MQRIIVLKFGNRQRRSRKFHDWRRQTLIRHRRSDKVIQSRRQLRIGKLYHQPALSHVARKHPKCATRSFSATVRSRAPISRNRGHRRPAR